MSTLFSDLQPQQESHDLVDEGSHASNGINLALAVKDHLNADCGDLQYLKGNFIPIMIIVKLIL